MPEALMMIMAPGISLSFGMLDVPDVSQVRHLEGAALLEEEFIGGFVEALGMEAEHLGGIDGQGTVDKDGRGGHATLFDAV